MGEAIYGLVLVQWLRLMSRDFEDSHGGLPAFETFSGCGNFAVFGAHNQYYDSLSSRSGGEVGPLAGQPFQRELLIVMRKLT